MILNEALQVRQATIKYHTCAKLAGLLEECRDTQSKLLWVYEQDVTQALRALELAITNSKKVNN
jgi:hypothetical protein